MGDIGFFHYFNNAFHFVVLNEDKTEKHFNHFEDTDEGYHSEVNVLRLDIEGGNVILEVTTHSQDCDGPLSTYDDYICPIQDLYGHDAKDFINGEWLEIGVKTPLWERTESHQRDYFAEAMGY
jgi:hypothetical protein